MKRYVVKKYVMAESLAEALKRERTVEAEDGWLDEKQPEPQEKPSLMGFDLERSGWYYSPYLKRKRKKNGRKTGKTNSKR